MQEDAGPFFAGFLPFQDDGAQRRQRQGEPAVDRADRLHAGIQGVGQLAVGQSVRVHADRPQGRSVFIHSDDKEAVFFFLSEYIPAAFDAAGIGKDVAVGVQRDETARPQGIAAAAQSCQLFRPRQDFFVLMPPRIGAAVVRVLSAGHAGFVAVINTGRAGHRHLPGQKQVQALLGDVLSRERIRIGVLGQDRQDAFDIVAADEVEHGVKVLRRIILNEMGHFSQHAPSFLAPHDEIDGNRPQGVVHSAVELIAAQVFALFAVADLIRRVFPHFSNEHGLGVFFLQRLIEIAEKRRRQLVDDVETPAADALAHPVAQHAVVVMDDKIHIRRLCFLYVWQIHDAPPRLVVVRVFLKPVPRIVRRFLGLVGADAVVMAEAVEINAVGPRMAEHAVQDDGQALVLSCPAERGKLFVRPQEGIDAVVIGRAVAMVRAAFKNRVEVNRRNA